MSSISPVTPAGLIGAIFSRPSQAIDISSDSDHMDPIDGTNVSPAVAQIAIKAMGDASNLEMAQARLVLDTVKDGGAQIVKLLENLGQNVDLYA